ncbi:MAG: hypothetical protein B7Z82_09070 [Halothiobacillus sp. 20-54-6]|nr:MAG: hypothetical protein B7Z82_09070 [Halothiobacillus sp. 20-54-6]
MLTLSVGFGKTLGVFENYFFFNLFGFSAGPNAYRPDKSKLEPCSIPLIKTICTRCAPRCQALNFLMGHFLT